MQDTYWCEFAWKAPAGVVESAPKLGEAASIWDDAFRTSALCCSSVNKLSVEFPEGSSISAEGGMVPMEM